MHGLIVTVTGFNINPFALLPLVVFLNTYYSKRVFHCFFGFLIAMSLHIVVYQ